MRTDSLPRASDVEELCALGRTSELPVAHLLAANYYANMLALVGRFDEAAGQVNAGLERARQQRNAMVLEVWATIDGMVHLAAGRLTAARAAVESLPSPEPDGATELDMVRMVILVQVAIHTDDRTLLQQMVSPAHDAYPLVHHGAPHGRICPRAGGVAPKRHSRRNALVRRGHDLFGTPLTPQALDQVILRARIASAGGDAAVRAQVLVAIQRLQHEERRSRCSPRSPNMSAGYSKAMPRRWSPPRPYLRRRRGRCSTPLLPKTPARQLILVDRNG